jgi:carboxypeptidase family protein
MGDTEGDRVGPRRFAMSNRRITAVVLAAALASASGCRAGQPIYSRTPADQTTPGTIAGIVSTGEGGEPLAGRRVYAVELAGSRRYAATTNVTGGFSIPVPPGKYRLEVELREGERVLRSPGTIDINKSDLDANLEVVIGS